ATAVAIDLHRSDARSLEVPSGEPLRIELEAFVDAIRTGVPPLTDGDSGLRAMRALSMVDFTLPATLTEVVA
ncbi:MAG: hypothetical protein JOZ38_12725, partial [Candidatus Eremiobacteraeota bacterium]|nr:hypothetical protein [Candidatus Eremiobacteraeota bacterium]